MARVSIWTPSVCHDAQIGRHCWHWRLTCRQSLVPSMTTEFNTMAVAGFQCECYHDANFLIAGRIITLPVFIVCVYMLWRYRPEKVNPPIPKKENNGLSVFNVVYLIYVTQYVCCVISRDTDKLSWLLLMAWSQPGTRPSTTNKRRIKDSQSNVAPLTKNMLQVSAFINTLWKTFN